MESYELMSNFLDKYVKDKDRLQAIIDLQEAMVKFSTESTIDLFDNI